MTAVNNNSIILYRYLRALSVKISRSTVHRLLDSPAENSLRGISDALDALYIKNEVHHFPPLYDYFLLLNTPFITMLKADEEPLCVVTKKDDFIVEFRNAKGEKHYIRASQFLNKWTGTVLFGEPTKSTPSESFYMWKNLSYYLSF
ncbi:hypothetical protein [Bacteroides sp.]|uniref:hypothetical protein n=1 Tax=Bacteroides sp. TaxID=29523 RepID=UPI003AB5F487